MEKKQIIIDNELTTFWITNEGKLFNEKTNTWYKGSLDGGYLKYDVIWKKHRYTFRANRLVAEYFLSNPNDLPVVNHIDGNKLNNSVFNLEWVSYSDNNKHAYDTDLKQKTNGMNARKQYDGDLEGEEWKQYNNSNYYISNKGRIRNIATNNLLKGKITQKGYLEWCLSENGKKKSYLAHRLVYSLFGGELQEGLVINHKDGNKTNNDISNLEQVSPSQNIEHSYYSIGHKNVKKVGQFSLDGELIAIYQSCADAARQTESLSNNISRVCNGKMKTHHGYVWKYLEE